ncbi:globin domain-containing protein [Staphylococcus pettenkoferi]|uniref:globin domain-containing protein n=1 Tax=Staphylococcus pettenkoferi TaxID=170573 RepID=UPI0002432194|nr:globin domain-containing protein [Staphylococcus pettenkoferi]ASE37358.1 nitric oxide dioxygenase [Staphylococcus pettenkoferi]EHM67171.1 putative flavohemoprotein [Staphylococcus pettenkoferi VCU012]MCY1580913.1 globin domain-containing protein [Staphylococcus pettenkoferi]MCY1619417.1 globin domain-containing protein [Staphylococcus pettenkoferi]
MLTESEIQTIKDTVPLLQDKGTEITSIFYPKMFNNHPELLNMFNQTNQKKGMQSTALAQAVLAAAMNIENLGAIAPAIMPVAYKHCALQVYPEHYPIVGENLLAAIQEVTGLSEDDSVIQTWAKAYGEIADVFIKLEKEVYDEMMWMGFKPFKITKITQETPDIKSFTVETNDYDLSQYKPGQYITVDVTSDKLPYRAKRHYSIVSGDEHHLTFGVRRDVVDGHEGEVSTILHDELSEGDTINLSAPVGGFLLNNLEQPQLFIGSGVGITPLVSMFDAASKEGSQSQMIQVAPSEDQVPFKEMIEEITQRDNANLHLHLKDSEGYLEKDELTQYLSESPEIYICGGTSFLNSIMEALKELEYDMSKVHYEVFVPRLSVEV